MPTCAQADAVSRISAEPCRRSADLCFGNKHWECSKCVLVFTDVQIHKELHKVCMLRTQAPVEHRYNTCSGLLIFHNALFNTSIGTLESDF